ncbi:MAG: erythromycin esterase family protein, partial [Spirochaetota bacterium]
AATALGGCDTLWLATSDYFDETTVARLAIEDAGAYAGYGLLESNLTGVRVLFSGEAHGTVESTQFALTTARYLSDSGRPTTLLWEVGFATGVYLDRYVTGGDESALSEILESSRGTYLFTHEWRRFYEALREWNADRAPEQAIRIVGIDVEHQHERGLGLMREYVEASGSAPAELAPLTRALLAWVPEKTYNEERELSRAIAGSFAAHRPAWDAYLGATSVPFAITSHAVEQKFVSYAADVEAFASIREEAIGEIFEQADAWHEARTAPLIPFYYGHWGRVHVRLAPTDGVTWIAGRIAADATYAGAVLAIYPLYFESQALRRSPYRAAPLADAPRDVGLFARHAQGPVTLFDLDEPGSPFHTSRELVPGAAAATTTTDSFQMVMLYSHTHASTQIR